MRIKLFLIFYLFSCCIFSQNAMELDSIQVVGFRSSKLDPAPFTTIESDSIRRITNSNSDPFFTISKSVPNSLSQSDNGTQYGYSYLRIRGMDQTRINFTLNGIPMNEMEDQGIYFSNMPGFYNSISRMDVSRGIGISKYGSTSVDVLNSCSEINDVFDDFNFSTDSGFRFTFSNGDYFITDVKSIKLFLSSLNIICHDCGLADYNIKFANEYILISYRSGPVPQELIEFIEEHEYVVSRNQIIIKTNFNWCEKN